ncbi:MAG: MFS transporter [Bacillota bacterium]
MSQTPVTPIRDSKQSQHQARNFWALAGDGIFFNFGSAFFEASSLIPAYVSQLTSSATIIGLITTIRNLGWLFPQLLVAGMVERLPLKKPMVLVSSAMMRLAGIFIAFSAWWWGGRSPAAALTSFLIGFVVYSFADGITGVPWTDIVGKTINARQRGRLFGTTSTIGGVLAFGAGFLINRLLDHPRLPFPHNFAAVFAIGALLITCSYISFATLIEPVGTVSTHQASMGAYLAKIPRLLRGNPAFARLAAVQFLLRCCYLGLPFYFVYGQSRLGFSASFAGILVSAQMSGSILASILWGYLSDHVGNSWVVRCTALTTVLSPLLAIVAGVLGGGSWFAVAVYLLLYACLGATFSGLWIGFTNYLLEIAPEEERPSYIGLMNTLMAPATFLPLLGGVIVTYLPHVWLFGATAALAGAGLLLSASLPEPRAKRQS